MKTSQARQKQCKTTEVLLHCCSVAAAGQRKKRRERKDRGIVARIIHTGIVWSVLIVHVGDCEQRTTANRALHFLLQLVAPPVLLLLLLLQLVLLRGTATASSAAMLHPRLLVTALIRQSSGDIRITPHIFCLPTGTFSEDGEDGTHRSRFVKSSRGLAKAASGARDDFPAMATRALRLQNRTKVLRTPVDVADKPNKPRSPDQDAPLNILEIQIYVFYDLCAGGSITHCTAQWSWLASRWFLP